MTKFWVSWHHTDKLGEFELHSPWWVSGQRGDDDAASICAAVQADSAQGAMNLVLKSYDETPQSLEWRFVEDRSEDWTPFSGRFPKADWMQWP